MGQYLDLLFRCYSRERWITVATSRGIYTGDIDPDSGLEIIAPGFLVDEIGGLEVSPGVLDTWWSCNLRLHTVAKAADEDTEYPGETEARPFTKSKLVRFVRENGTPITLQGRRAYEFGAGVNRVQILDPRDIETPQRIWVGGLEF